MRNAPALEMTIRNDLPQILDTLEELLREVHALRLLLENGQELRHTWMAPKASKAGAGR